MTMTSDEIRAAEYGEMAGELAELREWVAQVKGVARTVDDCLVPDLTEQQMETHVHNGVHRGCLRFLLTMIEDA